jgi:hypothetical protein
MAKCCSVTCIDKKAFDEELKHELALVFLEVSNLKAIIPYLSLYTKQRSYSLFYF